MLILKMYARRACAGRSSSKPSPVPPYNFPLIPTQALECGVCGRSHVPSTSEMGGKLDHRVLGRIIGERQRSLVRATVVGTRWNEFILPSFLRHVYFFGVYVYGEGKVMRKRRVGVL